MRRFLVLFAFICCAFGACDFSEFDKKFHSGDTKIKQRLHNEMKSAYIKAVINDDLSCKKDALKRLVIANKAFGKDASEFEKELIALGEKPKNNESAKKTQNSSLKAGNSSLEKKQNSSDKKTGNSSLKAENSSLEKKQNSSLKAENSSLEKKQNSSEKLKILSVTNNKNSLVIKLNKEIKKSDMKAFALSSSDTWRNVYDIEGTLNASLPSLENGISEKIRIAQTNPQVVRIVFEDAKKSQISAKFNDNEIVFIKGALSENKQSKETTKKEQKSTKNTKTKTEKNTKKEVKNEIVANEIKPDDPKENLLSKKEKSSKIIVLDPGHGGSDAGATSSNKKLLEKNIVLNISKKAAKILKDRGYKVLFTRSTDRFIKLRARTSFANDKNAHLFISIHANAAPNASKAKTMNGIETFFLSPSRSERSMDAANLENKADTDEMNYFTKVSFLNFLNREKIIASNKLAIDMQSALLKSVRSGYKVSDGGVREAPFWVLVGALMPAVLIEIGYISHPDESQKIANTKYQDKIALGVADGVDAYFAKNR